ncbi:MAG: DNA recombination protein RmuC [Calditrichaeota bacterium]|nr:DNA recombination protein RmuC [Calditrichota bacterium]MCB9475155.1 DNA recombination protein RmuC [Candidatus Delongbacteria bacterium]
MNSVHYPSLILGLLLAAAAGAFLLLWLRGTQQRREQDMQTRLAESLRREGELQERLHRGELEQNELRQRMDAERQRASGLEKDLEVERARLEERISALQLAEERLKESFSLISQQALDSNAKSFLSLAEERFRGQQGVAVKDLEARQQAVDALVRPIAETMKKLEDQLQNAERRTEGSGAALRNQLEAVTQGQKELAAETDRLRRALRQPGVRGRWGEMQLKRVAELAGMLEYCDFELQRTVVESEGGVRRPDMVIHLPGGKSMVVDAKTVMDAYMEAIDAPTEELRQEQMARHARQVRDQITLLSGKAYWNSLEHTPEFVVMFIPGEAFYSAALQQDPTLLEYGSEKRVLLAGPTTLLALLKAASYGWQQEVMTENARRVADTGKELHERLLVFARHFSKVRSGLQSAVDGYNSAVSSFESRVLVSARRIEELGVPVKESLGSQSPIDTQPRALTTALPGADTHADVVTQKTPETTPEDPC